MTLATETTEVTDTNFGKWRYYMKDCISPDSFINWSYFSLIASCLQRRVWTGDKRKALYPNLYVFPCGAPGIGKGMVIKEIANLLRYHKLDAKEQNRANMIELGKFGEHTKGKHIDREQYLIPIGPDAASYQRLVEVMSKSCRVVWQNDNNGKAKDIYKHSSLTICLEEMSSLFRKHQEDLVNFLLVAYDCGEYRYESISRGEDRIENSCLNLLAGTTPSFIKRVFGDELLTDGFSSRAIFVHALNNRFNRLRPPTFSEGQLKAYEELTAHIKKLGSLYGECKFTEEAEAYLEGWWCNEHPFKKPNQSPKLIPYYARKNIHVQKLAMILNFSETTEMLVTKSHCERALKILEQTEKQMHFAVSLDNKNPLNSIANDIYKFLVENGPQLKKDLLLVFFGELPLPPEESLKQCIAYLMTVGKVVTEGMAFKANLDNKSHNE